MRHTVTNRAPAYHVADTPWGTSYGAYRQEEDGRMSWRVANFLFPFWTQAPNSDFLTNVGVRGWVPMDDEHTMVVMLSWKKSPGAYTGVPLKNGKPIPGFAPAVEYLPNSTDWHGRWRPKASAENDYEIDRDRLLAMAAKLRAKGGLLVAYAGWMMLGRAVLLPPMGRLAGGLADGAVGLLGGLMGGLAGFPSAPLTVWCGLKGWDKARQRGVYQPFILPMQVLAVTANGSIGYVPNREAYPQGNYEVVSARGDAGSGEMLVETALRLLRELHPQK